MNLSKMYSLSFYLVMNLLFFGPFFEEEHNNKILPLKKSLN